ncbi:MAG: WD40 repeat domain-containing protein [Bacteroidetes bacterium]|nr:WD40 repeat domain-containing protein [Bacteroidota bacterium]
MISRNTFFFFLYSCCFIFSIATVYGQPFKLSATLHDVNSTITCMEATFDGAYLVNGDSSGTITFRSPENGNILNAFRAFNSPVGSINFNSTGQLMILTNREGEIKIYDFVQSRIIQSMYSPDYTNLRFALFSIADGFIYFNGQGRLYKTRSDLTQPVVEIFRSDSLISNAVITNDRSALIFTCGNTMKVLNTRTDVMTQELTTSSFAIERMTIAADNRLATWSADGTIVIWKYELNQLHSDLALWFKAGTSSKLGFSHDGNLLVTGNVGNWARIWKLSERNVVQELFGHTNSVTNYSFSANDQTLFTTGNDRNILIWKQKTEAPQKISSKDTVPAAEHIVENLSDSLKHFPVIPGLNDPTMPVIVLDSSATPENLGGRKIEQTTTIEMMDSTVDIFVFDHSTLDGDIMSLSFHNQWIIKHYEVTKQKKKITLQLKMNSNNYLVLFADNLGKTPPNTAAVSFIQNGREKIFRLKSDLKTCSAINFVYKKR